jgi:hypothetical protein
MTSRGRESKAVVEPLADALIRRGWNRPACLFLEASRPLALLGGQLVWMMQPLLGPYLSRDRIAGLASLLEEPEAMNALIGRLQVGEERSLGGR